MEFFIDTASITEIKKYKALGLVDGVTTNPALLAKEGRSPIEQIKEITALVDGPVSVEVTYTEPDKMVAQAKKLCKLADNIIIKVPCSFAGLDTALRLKAEGIKMNATLVFHPSQAVPFIKLGVEFASLFIGRVEDFGLSNVEAIYAMSASIEEMDSPTKLLSASIRNPEYLMEAIVGGSDAITVPPVCWEKVYSNPLFALGEKEFLESWRGLDPAMRTEYESLD
jgi:transaldolase